MNLNPTQQVLWDMEVLYKTTMELYKNFFKMLEAVIEKTPESEIEKLKELNALAEEAKEGLEADLALFDKTLSMDTEALANMQDKLKIEDIYNKLQK